MKQRLFMGLFLVMALKIFAGGAAEAAAGETRGQYLATQGYIIPADEVLVESYLASRDYDYPFPENSSLNLSLLTGNRQISSKGGSELIQIGLRGEKRDFETLPPLNIAFVIDTSGSMAGDNKLEWVQEAFEIFIDKVRPQDYVALVEFDNDAQVIKKSQAMDSDENKESLQRAVASMVADGGTNLVAGLELGYQQVMLNYRSEYTNRVLFLTDGIGDSEGIIDMALQFREMGINVSTIGVGDGFDQDLMIDLARNGGGSSRFISDREEMVKIFSTEFDRMAVPAAREVVLTVTLPEEVQLQNTWGYDHQIEGNKVTYFVPTLHNWDYETILLDIDFSPLPDQETFQLARIDLEYLTLEGEKIAIDGATIERSLTEDRQPVFFYSDYRVLQAASILDFTEKLIAISDIYYDSFTNAQIPIDASLTDTQLEALKKCLTLTRESKALFENTALRLDLQQPFEDQMVILDAYENNLISLLGEEYNEEETLVTIEEDYRNDRDLVDNLNHLFTELLLQLKSNWIQDSNNRVAFSDINFQTNANYPAQFYLLINTLMEEQSKLTFSLDEEISILSMEEVRSFLNDEGISAEDLMDTTKAIQTGRDLGARYFLTGSFIELGNSFISFSRLIDVLDGEILAASQIVLDKESTLDTILGN